LTTDYLEKDYIEFMHDSMRLVSSNMKIIDLCSNLSQQVEKVGDWDTCVADIE